ncbi:MAG: hypothetical protein SCK28_13250 [Bacillota bacterium]|nr:hypothetical protein [Bacillota bacterium]
MTKDMHVKFGGVKFSNNTSPNEINRFVRELPASKKDSLFEVIKELDKEGLITVDVHSVSTIDDESISYQES